MRKFFVHLFAIVAVWFCSSSALAVNLIYEPFDYTSGQALGPPSSAVSFGQRNEQAGTTAGDADNSVNTANPNYLDGGVGNKWLRAAPPASPANSINIAGGSLTGPSELKAPIGNSLTILDGTNNGAVDRLAFRANTLAADNITTGTIYYSFLLRVDDLTGANNGIGDYFISLNNTANNSTTVNPTVIPGQMRARIDPADGTKFSLGMFTQRTTMTQADPAWVDGLTVGDTIFVVASFTLNSGGTNNSARIWVNPDQSSFGQPTAPTPTATDTVAGANGGTIGSLLLHQRNVVPGLAMDELRVATTWSEATPLGTATFYWDINGSTAGAGGATPSGTWDSSTSNWNNGNAGDGDALLWSSGAAATFSAGGDATGAYTITVSGTQSASGITFEDGTPTLTGGTLNLTGIHTITASTGVTATIESVVSGSDGLVKAGAGTVALTANETYSGPTNISAGTLQLGNGGTTGTLPTSSAITTSGTLAFNRSNNVTQGVDFSGAAIDGTGGLTQAGSGTLTLNTANTFSGTTRAAAGTLSLTNSLALQNSTLDMNGSDTGAVNIDSSLTAVTLGGITGSRNFALVNSASAALALTVGSSAVAGPYTGALSGGGSLTKSGTGAQTISGDNIYTGGTTINAGTLQFGQTISMPASGAVTVNIGGTLAVNVGGAGEWTDSTDDTIGGTIGSIIKGRGGRGTANQVSWISGSALGVDTTNSGGTVLYSGNIGGFRTTGGGTIESVGFTKRGTGTLELSGNNTFSGPLSMAANGGTLLLTGTNANAGSTMAIPTVGIGGSSTLQIGVSNVIPIGSLISTQGGQAIFEVKAGFTQTVRSISGNNGIVRVEAGAVLTIADQAGDDYVFGNGGGTANVHSADGGKIYKTGAGTFTLFGDAGGNFLGEFILQNGTLKLSRNQALGTTGGTGRLTVQGGQLGRSNTPTSNFSYAVSNLDLHVFRYDLSDAPAQTSQFGTGTVTTLKENNVEFNITNSGTQNAASGRFIFLGDIRNNDPFAEPSAPNRGITKTGNGVLQINASGTTDPMYRGSTTVQDGLLLVDVDATLGDYSQATIGTLNLNGGAVATTTTRTTPIMNPIAVNGPGGISHVSTVASASTVMDFSSDSVGGTSGSLTITNGNTANNSNTVFRPTFTGSGFNFGLPIVISNSVNVGTGVKSNELQSGNSSGTQTFSGPISGGGSLRRINGGTTVLSGSNTYSGGTFVEAGTLTANGSSATFGAGNVTVTGGVLSILSGVTNAIANAATLSIATPALVDLGGGINETLAALILDGNAQANGTYGSSSSSAQFQLDQYFTGTGILTVVPAGLPGDFNSDGKVDAGDYVTWRKNQNTNNALANDNGLGTPVGTAHYNLWRANFGKPPGAGSGGGLNGSGAVPEPASLMLLICAAGCSDHWRPPDKVAFNNCLGY